MSVLTIKSIGISHSVWFRGINDIKSEMGERIAFFDYINIFLLITFVFPKPTSMIMMGMGKLPIA